MQVQPLGLTQPVPSGTTGTQCITGFVELTATPGIGATVGTITPLGGTPITIRQVPGPALSGVPLSTLNRQFATVCGNFVFDDGRFVFNVRVAAVQARPIPLPIAQPIVPQIDLQTLLLLLLLFPGLGGLFGGVPGLGGLFGGVPGLGGLFRGVPG